MESELASYSESLALKPRLVVATKLDILPLEEGAELVKVLSTALGVEILPISAVTGLGLKAFLTAADRLLQSTQSLFQ